MAALGNTETMKVAGATARLFVVGYRVHLIRVKPAVKHVGMPICLNVHQAVSIST
jgi:hypothetical protein